MSDNVEQKGIELVATHGGVAAEKVTPDHHFVSDLEFDSLTRVEFAMDLEDEFELSAPDESLDQFQTVGQVIDFARNHRDETGQSKEAPGS